MDSNYFTKQLLKALEIMEKITSQEEEDYLSPRMRADVILEYWMHIQRIVKDLYSITDDEL